MTYLVIPALVVMLLVLLARRPSLEARLQRALQEQRQGNLAPLRALSRKSFGDAAYALFLHLDAIGEQAAALAALKRAVNARIWLDSRYGVARREYGHRCFLGVGTEPDHVALLAQWGARGWREGAGWEPELAWIQACGPEACRDLAQAWYWLCLADARQGEGMGEVESVELAHQVRQRLIAVVPESVRRDMQAQAARTAYDDYVSGR